MLKTRRRLEFAPIAAGKGALNGIGFSK